MKINLLGFDFDSVIVDTAITLCGLITEHLGYPVGLETIKHYTIELNYPGMTKKDAEKILNLCLNHDNTIATPTIDGALDFLKWYAKTNYIYIITNRKVLEPVDFYLQHNLDKQTYEKVNLYYTKDKGKLCRSLGVTHFIDDYMNNIVNVANAGIIPILFSRSWNINILKSGSILRQLIQIVNSWEDIYHLITCKNGL
jgi:hypothetical protein